MFEYNTRIVTISATLLGAIAGAVGVYLLLRRKSLIGDTICHAALPGLALSFLVQIGLGGSGRSQLLLLLGAALSGALGSVLVLGLNRWTRLKPDAVLGIVLSVFSGLGMVLFSISQRLSSGNAAGLENFILGKTATIVYSDFRMIAITSILLLITLVLLRKELQILCFDSPFAAATGWPVLTLDLILIASVLLVVIVGANVVGVILVVALMVIPPATARFWTNDLTFTVLLSTAIGALSGLCGSLASLFIDDLPSGPSIVIVSAFFFAASLLLGSKKGFLWRWVRMRNQRNEAESEHVLRAIFEVLESSGAAPNSLAQSRSQVVSAAQLVQMRNWKPSRLHRSLDSICRKGWGIRNASNEVALTASGIQASLRAVRRHRLLELYFSNLANLSPGALDRGADALEHVLDDDMLAKLELELKESGNDIVLPPSVHPLPSIENSAI